MTLTFTARTPEDLIAAVPVVLGFEPEESIAMLTFAGPQRFHGRVDLPPPEEVDDAVQALLRPSVRHRAGKVCFVLYTGDERRARRVARRLLAAFLGAGISVIDVLRVHDGRWYAAAGRAGVPRHGVPFDVSAHPFRLEALVRGQVVAGSREELAARLAVDATAAVAVEQAMLGLVRDGSGLELSGPAVRALLDRHREAGTDLTDAEAAQVLWAVRQPSVRDHAWLGITRHEAEGHVRLWTDLVRRAPGDLVASAAAVLAFAAWMAGHGALAWCAVDRSFAAQEGHPLARLVADLLDAAVPPLDDWSVLGLEAG